MVTVLGVEARVVHQIDATADDVTGGEGRSVRLPVTGRAERVAIVTVVTIRLLVPARQPIHLEVRVRQPDAHVTIAPLRDDLHLEVVQPASGRYRVRRTHRGSI